MKAKLSPGERLRRWRVARQLTQAELGKALLISQSTVASYEQGRAMPRIRIAKSIRALVGISIEDWS